MDSENQQRYQAPSTEPSVVSEQHQLAYAGNGSDQGNQPEHKSGVQPTLVDCSDPDSILNCLRAGQLLVVNGRARNGLVLYKEFYAEFAGPGAAVGSVFDLDCQKVLPVGNLSLLYPETHEDRQRAYLIRRQWIRLTQQFTDKSVPLQRAQMILNQFETYFDPATIARIPDEAFALMVGVLPHSIRMARRTPGQLNVKVKA